MRNSQEVIEGYIQEGYFRMTTMKTKQNNDDYNNNNDDINNYNNNSRNYINDS